MGASSEAAWAQCVTTGAITADCTLTSSTTGAITVGDTNNQVTVTIGNSAATLDHTIDDDNATPDGNIVADGVGLTVTQNAAIGTINAINTIRIADGSGWSTTADITTAGAITVGDGTSGSLIINGGPGTSINGGAGSGAIVINNGASVQIATLNIVSVGVNGGLTIAGTGVLQIDGSNATVGSIDGASDGEGILTLNASHDTDAAIGSISALATINIAAGTFTVDQDVTATSTVFTAGGAALDITSGAYTSAITGSSGGDTVTIGLGTIVSEDISLGAGDDVLTLNSGAVTGALDGGAGSGDALTLGVDFTTTNTITNFEQIDVSGNVFTVEHAITNLATATQDGLDVGGGTLNINDGGSLDGTVYDSIGGGSLTFGADASGGTFNLGGKVEDVNVNIASGTLNTNGNAVGALAAISNLTVASSSRLNVNDAVTSDGDLTKRDHLYRSRQDFNHQYAYGLHRDIYY